MRRYDPEYRKAYYRKNKEKSLAGDKAWAAKNPDKVAAKNKRYRMAHEDALAEYARRYRDANRILLRRKATRSTRLAIGVDEETYNAMELAQGGVCAVCKTQCRRGHELCVDHSHDTGQVRGLLCKDCNVALGYLKDSPQLCRALEAYIYRHHGPGYQGYYPPADDEPLDDNITLNLFTENAA